MQRLLQGAEQKRLADEVRRFPRLDGATLQLVFEQWRDELLMLRCLMDTGAYGRPSLRTRAKQGWHGEAWGTKT